MTLTDEVYQALRGLGAGDHSTRDVWWAVYVAQRVPVSSIRDAVSSGNVENALTALWEQERVTNPAVGRWALPAETQTAMQVEG